MSKRPIRCRLNLHKKEYLGSQEIKRLCFEDGSRIIRMIYRCKKCGKLIKKVDCEDWSHMAPVETDAWVPSLMSITDEKNFRKNKILKIMKNI